MSDKTQAILEQAMKLSTSERAEVAEQLIASLDETPDADVEKTWQEEVQRRIREVDSGEVKTIPWEVVQKQLRHGK
ncbi:MAG: addiction module protein [Nitrospinae bacterium]|nr:addiction module protein [Nitrospinota bacterium]